MQHIVILGNGIAGVTAARHIRKLGNHRVTIVSGETDHFFSRTALMYLYMGHMKYENTKPYEDWFWKKNNIELKRGWVLSIEFAKKQLLFEDGDNLAYDQLILATGSQPNKFGWKGQDLEGVQGLYAYQDLELMVTNTKSIKKAVIVGGGLIGIEMAEMLRSRAIDVTYLVRESHFWNMVLPEEEATMIDSHIRKHHVDLRLGEELEEIIDDGHGKVSGIKTKSGEIIECEFVGLTVGVHPNVHFLKDSPLEIDRGILVDNQLQTNIPDVYAIGDCAQLRNPAPHRRAIEAVWYVGRMMGETVARTVCGKPTAYKPGIWFNSAKFFDIEYQTYGHVPATPESSFYWEHENGKICLHIPYDPASMQVSGVNILGMRQRHEVWDEWIRKGTSLKEVIENLDKAHFDPEFFKRHEQDIQARYNAQFPDRKVTPRKKGLLERILH